jgi:formylglycine-generating enzyme required for sulfatase activity
VLLLAAALAPQTAAPQTAAPKYPEPPPGEPPPLAIEGADAADAASMRAYEERIPGTVVRFRMVPIPGGKFRIGSPESEPGREEHEGPQTEVTIEPFWMEEHEVTWDEFRVFQFALDRAQRAAGESAAAAQDAWADAVSRPTPPYVPMDFGMGIEGCPAVCMTQFAARQYTKWLSMKTGRFYRLPSEAEWEYACRAGTATAWSCGDDPARLDDYAWHYGNAGDKYQPVMGKQANPWGLFDMHGNVAEWCLDQLRADTYAGWSAAQATAGAVAWPDKLYPHVVRGGSFEDEPALLRSAARRGSDKEWKIQDPQFPKSIWYFTDARFVGFRVVRPLQPPPPAERARYWDADVESIREIDAKQRQGERS